MHAESTRSPPPDTRTLGDLVASVARRTPDGVLVACAVAGVVGVGLIALLVRSVWWLTPFTLVAAAFGAWGIADRERAALGVRGGVFRVLRAVAALVGGAAAAFAAVMLFVLIIGPLIS
jgi:hypothetical protein